MSAFIGKTLFSLIIIFHHIYDMKKKYHPLAARVFHVYLPIAQKIEDRTISGTSKIFSAVQCELNSCIS